jgi:hypothetical protein
VRRVLSRYRYVSTSEEPYTVTASNRSISERFGCQVQTDQPISSLVIPEGAEDWRKEALS